jgi:hypothetical protein
MRVTRMRVTRVRVTRVRVTWVRVTRVRVTRVRVTNTDKDVFLLDYSSNYDSKKINEAGRGDIIP